MITSPPMNLLRRLSEPPDGGFRPFRDEDIEQSIPRRFEQQVRAFGDRPAIRWPGGSYTYASLNRIANRLARTLAPLVRRRLRQHRPSDEIEIEALRAIEPVVARYLATTAVKRRA